jgi:predicted transcriptional regulator
MSKWLRFNRAQDLVWVTDPDGVPRALTRKQAEVYGAIRQIAGTGTRVTMRSLAERLGTAPSTVYRAAVKLTAMGFIAYQSNRGRLGGSMFLLRVPKDGLDWCRDIAKATVRRWWKASEERISRMRRNVAAYFPDRKIELYEHRYIDNGIDRNKYEPWTPESIQEALGER